MLRLFVGIALPPELKLRLSLLAAGVPGARWVDPGNYHLTLRFIGEVGEDLASDIDGALLPLRAKPFAVTITGVGRFADRMLWAGVEKSEALVHLRDKIESALVRLGLEPETRRYAPHVSLARLRNASEAKVQAFLQ